MRSLLELPFAKVETNSAFLKNKIAVQVDSAEGGVPVNSAFFKNTGES